MISVYRNSNKDRKQYKVKNVKKGTTKTGSPYTTFRINDNKQDPATKAWSTQSYSIFVWEDLDIQDEEQMEFIEIESVECAEKEWNGEKRIERTIFARVKPIINRKAQQEPNFEQSILGEVEESDDFPF